MKSRNIYKDIVISAGVCMIVILLFRWGKAWKQQQEIYHFTIESQVELTKEIADQFQNLKGIRKFEPTDSVTAVISIGEYSMQADLKGIDLQEYPVQWNKVQETITLGNTAALFLSENSFTSFVDENGYSPGKSQIEKWIKNYSDISLTITEENGTVSNAKIFGILKEPNNMIGMDKTQMEEVFIHNYQVKGGYMEIQGYRNFGNAKKLLENAGFSCYNEKNEN